jgi:hypothetical protein
MDLRLNIWMGLVCITKNLKKNIEMILLFIVIHGTSIIDIY